MRSLVTWREYSFGLGKHGQGQQYHQASEPHHGQRAGTQEIFVK